MPAVNITAAPGITAMINGGALSTSDPLVVLTIFSPDRIAGSKSAGSILIYGAGVDTKCDPYVQTLSASSVAQPFRSSYPVVLSSGAGAKAITVSVLNREGLSASANLSIAYTVNAAAPMVTMVGHPSPFVAGRISSALTPFEFDYRIDQACNEIRIAAVPSLYSPITEATTIKTFTGTYTAGQFFSAVGATPSMGYVTYAELVAAGAVLGPTFVKVFAKRTVDSVWSL